jgi:phenylacetate-CoA ligase/benzoylacetate-CoA ligase
MSGGFHEIESRPWQEVQSRHADQLPEQLRYLADASEYYRKRFDEWGIGPAEITDLEAFTEVPFTTKQDERDAQADAPSEQPLGEHQAAATADLNRTISSSGTTGRPTYFGLTRADRESWNDVHQRFFYGTGIRPEDTVVFGVGQTMVPGGVPYFEGLTELGANAVPAGGGSTERLVAALEDLYADVFFSTISHARYLIDRAEEVLGYPLAELPVDKVVVGGEPGMANPEIRAEIREGWGASVVRECMGLGDIVAGLWAECAAEGGMHFVGHDHVYPELVDPDTGEPVPFEPGATGELVYTPLGREATPLLRFRSGDHAEITWTACDCGRTAPRIRCIGRTDDMLIYKGMNVFPTAIRDVVSSVEGATVRVRVVVPDADTVRFDDPIPVLVGRDPASDRSDEAIAEDVIETVRASLQVRIEPKLVDPGSTDLSRYKTDLVVAAEPFEKS